VSSQEQSKFFHVEGGRHVMINGESKFVRNEFMTIQDVPGYRKRNNNFGLYLSAYIYDNPDPKQGALYADFYLDFDDEEDFEKVRKDAIFAIWYLEQAFKYGIPKSLIRIYYSGKKGVHIVIPASIFSIEPHTHLNEYYKVMAKDIADHAPYDTIDLKIYDRRRLFRMVNSQHQGTGLYKVPITYNELVSSTVEEIREIASAPRQVQYPKPYPINHAKREFEIRVSEWGDRFGKAFSNRRKGKSKPLDFTPACIQEMIDSGPQKGQRNHMGCVLGAFWRKQGLSEEEAWNEMVKWNNDSMDKNELHEIIKKMYNNDYEYGCSTLESLATCIGDKCPLYRKNK